MRGGGRRNYFDNPFEQRGDLSHASIFIVAIFVFVGVGAVLYYGNRIAIPADPVAALGSSLPAEIQRVLPTVAPGIGPTAGPTAAPATNNMAAGSAGVAAPAGPADARQGVVVANGNGAAICRTPNLNDQLLTWPDGTGLELLGEEKEAQGGKWLKVKDPRGNIGWMLSQSIQIAGR